ncbi:MAG: archaeosortase/exosortase family protein [Rubritalea sp.]|uniref:archaeosortase/exosortase family protein n=1 Tax=Rubritalea sp. TaxID=2109375 RepID=UPI003242F270
MQVKKHGWIMIAYLIATAVWIWLRDLSWLGSVEDTLPVLCALPISWWLGQPWKRLTNPSERSTSALVIGCLLIIGGVVADLTLLMTLGWTALLFRYLESSFAPSGCGLRRLILLPILAFPWIATDFNIIGWWFRLSGAWMSAQLFSLVGFSVEQQGTFVTVEGLPVSIEAACSGLNLLQSLLIAGSALAILKLPSSRRFWIAIALLPLIAWLTNTVRILFITVIALTFGVDFAVGLFHTWGGILVIVLMFIVCWKVFQWLQNGSTDQAPPNK